MDSVFIDYIKRADILNENLNIDFSDKSFAYDYNEVQECFFDCEENNYVILAGETGLRKKEMLARICQDLYSCGVEREDVLYLDYDLPILHDENVYSFIANWVKERNKSKRLYIVINELQEVGDWFKFMESIRANFSHIKLIASSSTPSQIYEKIYDTNTLYCKIVVLSQKNESNKKYQSYTFGVYDQFKYNIKNGLAEIKGLTKEGKKMTSHIVPSEIDGYPVKVIASGAFHDRKEMESIDLPDSIEIIGDYSFSKCENLIKIRLPKSLTYIGDHSFLGAKKLLEIIGGDSVIHIGNSAFYDTKWLNNCGDYAVVGSTLYKYIGCEKAPILPRDIKQIASYAFANAAIESIDCSAILQIGEGVFYNCKNLKSIKLKTQNIPAFSFYGCQALDVSFDVNIIGKFAFYGCNALKSICARVVDDCGLANCSSLKTLKFIISFSNGAVYNCDSLSTLDWSGVKGIGKFAVAKTSIEEVNLNNAVTLGDYAFWDSKNLSSVTINEDCLIGRGSLYGCNKVSKMNIAGKHKLNLYFGGIQPNIKELVVMGDITDNFCRNNTALEKLTLKEVNYFGSWSFYANTALSEIVLDNILEIGDWAFAYCDKITKITLPNGLRNIGMNAFRYCHNLESIALQNEGVVHFGANAFYSTSQDKTFFIPPQYYNDYLSVPEWREYKGLLKHWKW